MSLALNNTRCLKTKKLKKKKKNLKMYVYLYIYTTDKDSERKVLYKNVMFVIIRNY